MGGAFAMTFLLPRIDPRGGRSPCSFDFKNADIRYENNSFSQFWLDNPEALNLASRQREKTENGLFGKRTEEHRAR
jgi:hypothetical protein